MTERFNMDHLLQILILAWISIAVTGQTHTETCFIDQFVERIVRKMGTEQVTDTNATTQQQFNQIIKQYSNVSAQLGSLVDELKEATLEITRLNIKISSLERSVETNEMNATDCSDITLPQGGNEIGVYKVYIPGVSCGIDVFCDQDGWLVIQRRIDGSENFYRGWSDYKYGFGDIRREFWLGNENIVRITNGRIFELRIQLGDFDGEYRYANYKSFSLGGASTNYKLTVSGYSGTAGDALTRQSGARFATYDDGDTHNCAGLYKGGWWYAKCHDSNLNGLYLNGTHASYGNGMAWMQWRGYYYSYKKVEMKIRRW